MRNKTALVSLILLGGILLGLSIIVIALGTSTGVAVGGETSVVASAEAEKPVYAQGGWIKNDAPWPIQVTSVTLDQTGTSTAPTVYMSSERTVTPPEEGEDPAWTAVPATFPFTIAPGTVQYLGFALQPDPGSVAAFDTMTVKGQGLMGFGFEQRHFGVVVVASAADLPFSMAAEDPNVRKDSFTQFLDLTVQVLDRETNTEQLLLLMGPDATPEEAEALQLSQATYVPEMTYTATKLTDDGRTQAVVFYLTDPEADALPMLRFTWADYRWSVALAE